MSVEANQLTNIGQDTVQQCVLQFFLGKHLFCIPLAYTKCVLHFVKLQPIPGMPNYVKGVLNFHGQDMLAVDLAEQLGVTTEAVYYTNTPIIICAHRDRFLALIVSDTLGLEYINTHLAQMDTVFKKSNIPYLKSDVSTQAGDALLLDVEQLFDANKLE